MKIKCSGVKVLGSMKWKVSLNCVSLNRRICVSLLNPKGLMQWNGVNMFSYYLNFWSLLWVCPNSIALHITYFMFLVLWWVLAVWTVHLHNLTRSSCLFQLVSFVAFPCSVCTLCSVNRGETASKEKQFQLSSNIFHKIQNGMWADRLWDWSCVLAQANDPCNF